MPGSFYNSRKPIAHLSNRRYNPHPSGPCTVKAYSNCATVELLLNGRSQGKLTGNDRVFHWQVTLPEGQCWLEAIGRQNGHEVHDTIVWTCSASAPAQLGPVDASKLK